MADIGTVDRPRATGVLAHEPWHGYVQQHRMAGGGWIGQDPIDPITQPASVSAARTPRYCQDLWMRLFQAASCWSGEAVSGSTSSPFLKVAPART